MDYMQIYMNNGKTVKFSQTMSLLYVVNFDFVTGEYNFDNIYDKNVSTVQQVIYEVVINYPSFQKIFKIINRNIYNFYTSTLTIMFNTTVNLSVALMASHIFLIIVCFVIIKNLNRIIYENNVLLHQSLSDATLVQYLKNKMIILMDISEMYVENPLKLNKKLKKLYLDFSEITNQKKFKKNNIYESQKNNTEVVINKFQNYFGMEDHYKMKIESNDIVAIILMIMFLSFSFYYLYSLFF